MSDRNMKISVQKKVFFLFAPRYNEVIDVDIPIKKRLVYPTN